MSKKNTLICTLSVLNALIFNYVAQISHVQSSVIVTWSLHEWVGAGMLVAYAGISQWITFIVNPNEAVQNIASRTN